MGRRALVLLVALLLAGVAAFAVYSFVQDYKGKIDEAQEMQVVFRAVQAVPEGQDGELFLQTPMWVEGVDRRLTSPSAPSNPNRSCRQ